MSYQKGKSLRSMPLVTSQSQQVKIIAEIAKTLYDRLVAELLKGQS
jgi:hypothetical protein